jgi:hypothetical protein
MEMIMPRYRILGLSEEDSFFKYNKRFIGKTGYFPDGLKSVGWNEYVCGEFLFDEGFTLYDGASVRFYDAYFAEIRVEEIYDV